MYFYYYFYYFYLLLSYSVNKYNCDALRDLVSFVQFKKREKHSWRNSHSSVFIYNFELISHFFLVFLLSNLNKQMVHG